MTQRWLAALTGALVAIGLTGIARAQQASGQPPVGLWLTQDHRGVIRIAPCGQNMCGSIVGQSAAGPEPPVAARCGLMILTVAPSRPGVWDGHITNPEDGQVWNAQIWQDTLGKLHLRGYVALPLLGQTQIWTRYAGRLATGCRMD